MADDPQDTPPLALIVDDDVTIRLLAREAIECAGLRVEEAEDGEQALDLYQRLKPDIVLMDVMMPEMDGFAACEALRKLPGGDRTPVLFLTGIDDVKSIARAYDVGATDFMQKPWHGLILGERVRYILRAQKILDELHESETKLASARDQALESSRLKSEFLANISHELLTPMNGLVGMTSLLIETELTSEQHEYTEVIQRSGDALLTLIHDLLDYSQMEAGILRLKVVDFHFRNALETTLTPFIQQADRKGLKLFWVVHPTVPSVFRGDPDRIGQILKYLLDNAIKFTEGGKISVQVRVIEMKPDGVVLKFEITDTGIGISEKAKDRLFQAFSQADGSSKRKYGGTGMGLAIAKNLAEMMEGRIGVDSTLGKGSTFWFTARFRD